MAIIFYSIAASFFSMLIYRLNNDVSLINPKNSICPHCKHQLAPHDLIPIYSYLKNGGKCAYCKKKIDLNYFLLEIIFVLWGVLGIVFKIPLLTVFLCLSLAVILFSDLKYKEIPYLFMGLTAVLAATAAYKTILSNWQNIFLVIIFYAVIKTVETVYYKKEVFGRADIILFVIFSFYFSINNFILFIYLSFFLGAVVSGLLMLFRVVSKQALIPFAPYIVISFYLTEFFGRQIIAGYWKLFDV